MHRARGLLGPLLLALLSSACFAHVQHNIVEAGPRAGADGSPADPSASQPQAETIRPLVSAAPGLRAPHQSSKLNATVFS